MSTQVLFLSLRKIRKCPSKCFLPSPTCSSHSVHALPVSSVYIEVTRRFMFLLLVVVPYVFCEGNKVTTWKTFRQIEKFFEYNLKINECNVWMNEVILITDLFIQTWFFHDYQRNQYHQASKISTHTCKETGVVWFPAFRITIVTDHTPFLLCQSISFIKEDFNSYEYYSVHCKETRDRLKIIRWSWRGIKKPAFCVIIPPVSILDSTIHLIINKQRNNNKKYLL